MSECTVRNENYVSNECNDSNVSKNHAFHLMSYIIRWLPVRRVPPHFSIPPESVEVMPGGSVNLTCVAIGSPMPFVKWRLGALELTPEDNVPIGKNVLMLNEIRESATYTCVAASDLGNIEADADVKVKGRCLISVSSYAWYKYELYSNNNTNGNNTTYCWWSILTNKEILICFGQLVLLHNINWPAGSCQIVWFYG